MKLSVFILSVLAIGLKFPAIVGQSANNNNLIISELQSLLSQTQQKVHAYLSTILVDSIIKNVDAIFATSSLNLATVVNKNYGCSRLTATTTSTTTTISTKTTTTTTSTTTISSTTTSKTTTSTTTTTTKTLTTTTTTTKTTTTATSRTTTTSTTTTTTISTTTTSTTITRNLLSVFTNSTIQSTFNQFNGNYFGQLAGFGIYSSPNTTYYYVMDYDASEVFILNDEWKFVSFKTFSGPANMISIGNSLYMTGSYNVWKVDQDLNILIEYNPGDNRPYYPGYRGISYNPSNGLINVASFYFNEIKVFNLDLTLIRRFSTSPYFPWSIAESSNQLYVGTEGGIIIVYQNEIRVNKFYGCDGSNDYMTSILFDQNGYMAAICDYSHKVYLFTSNVSFTGNRIITPNVPSYIGFDSKGRFILVLVRQIIIYD